MKESVRLPPEANLPGLKLIDLPVSAKSTNQVYPTVQPSAFVSRCPKNGYNSS